MIVKHALPLIEAIAAWERENGTVAAIMPCEYPTFMAMIKQAANHPDASARAALWPTPLTLYEDHGYTTIDFDDHVELQDGSRHMVLVSLVFDDGDLVGPENTEAVCVNIGEAHNYIRERFNRIGMRCVQIDHENAFCGYRLFFGEEKESNMTIILSLVPLA